MSKPRRSLRDRDQDAITAAEAEEPAPGLEDPAPARETTPKLRTTPVPQVRTETTTRIGLYFQEQVFQDAKSAYLVDSDVDRERAHGDQRVNDLRASHEQQISQFREELTQVRDEARDQRSRADRAEAQHVTPPAGNTPGTAGTGSRRRGKTAAQGQS